MCIRQGDAEGSGAPSGRMSWFPGSWRENSFGSADPCSVPARSHPWDGPRNGSLQGAEWRFRRKKRVSKFDERSRYVIENKGSRLRTKPNEANFLGTDGDADIAAPEEGEVNPTTPESLRPSDRRRNREPFWYHGLRYPAQADVAGLAGEASRARSRLA